MTKWDDRFLNLAQTVASWSKDPSTKVGCVLVDNNKHVISTGYNGFPRGVEDLIERYEDREVKYKLVQHAEANSVIQSVASTEGATAYVTHMPCSNCAGMLISAGIKRVVTTVPEGGLADRFKDSFFWSGQMFHEAGVQLDIINETAD